jgi:hypothetical protein
MRSFVIFRFFYSNTYYDDDRLCGLVSKFQADPEIWASIPGAVEFSEK